MATVSKPNTFTSGTTIFASEVNDNFDTLYNDYNGNIGNVNISGSAAIQESKFQFSASGHDHSDDATDGQGINLAKAKIASEAQGDILLRGASDWERLSVGTSGQQLQTAGAAANPLWVNGSTLTLTTRGDILYRNATVLARLAAGTSGQFLKTLGSSLDPVWSNAQGWIFVETLATTSGSSVVSATLPTDSDIFMVVCEAVDGGAAQKFGFRPNSNDTADKSWLEIDGGTLSEATGQTSIRLGEGGSSASLEGLTSGVMYVPRLVKDSRVSFAINMASLSDAADQSFNVIGGTWISTAATITTLNFITGGTFAAGAIHIYKLVQ